MILDRNNMKRLMLLIFYTIVLLALALKPERALAAFLWPSGPVFVRGGDCLCAECAHAVH